MVSALLFVCFASTSYSQDTARAESATLKEVSTIGIFDGNIITVGNFEREKVYKINEYCISLADISDSQVVSFTGKRVLVVGKLKIIEGKYGPTKTSTDGTIFEPYKEPDKIFISEPSFTIVYDSREPLENKQ